VNVVFTTPDPSRMKVLTYNVPRTSLIKNVTTTILTWLSLYTIFNSIWDTLLPQNYWQLGIAIVIITVGMLIQSLIDFEQVLEVKDRHTFMTYYRAGVIKFSRKLYTGPVDVLLEQDDKRYFCITLKTTSGNLIIERIPTLKQANQRFEEVRAIFI
jgi:hypothetical protein